MGWRAAVIQRLIRITMKHRIKRFEVHEIRRIMTRLMVLLPQPPSRIKVGKETLGGKPAWRFENRTAAREKVILYFHGGGYVVGSPRGHANLLWRLADAAGAPLIAPVYRLAPEHPFPAAVEDALAAYRGLLAESVPAQHIALAGDSAGGGLAFACLMAARDEGLPMPAALAALSPWTDLAGTGASMKTKAKADPMLKPDLMQEVASLYLQGQDPKTALASPLYGDPSGLPPTLFQVGAMEILADDSVRMARQLETHGIAADLRVWPGMHHVWQILAPWIPEAEAAIEKLGLFLKKHLGITPNHGRQKREPM